MKRTTDSHPLHRHPGTLRRDSTHVEPGPAAVNAGPEIEFSPRRSVTAPGTNRDGIARCRGPCSLGIGVEGVVRLLPGGQTEVVACVVEFAVFFPVGPDLVPDYYFLDGAAGVRELDGVFVCTGRVGRDPGDVAAVWIAHVAGVAVACARGVGYPPEAGADEGVVGGDGGPGGAGGWGWVRGGCRGGRLSFAG